MEGRKNDKYRDGQFVPMLKSSDPWNAVTLLQLFLRLGGQSSEPEKSIFRQCYSVGGKQGLKATVASYSNMNEKYKKALGAVGEDPKKYATHSSRSGAASHTANDRNVSDRQWSRHGGWRSDARFGYVEEDLESQLAAARSLAL